MNDTVRVPFWNPTDPPGYPNTLNKWVEENVIMAVEQAVEEDGTFLIDHDKPGIQLTFLSWEMPEDKKVFGKNGRVEKCSYASHTTLEFLFMEELEMYMERQADQEELREFVEAVEALATKVREKSGI